MTTMKQARAAHREHKKNAGSEAITSFRQWARKVYSPSAVSGKLAEVVGR